MASVNRVNKYLLNSQNCHLFSMRKVEVDHLWKRSY